MLKVTGTIEGEKVSASYDADFRRMEFSAPFVKAMYEGEQSEFDGLLPGCHYVGTDIEKDPWVFVGVLRMFMDNVSVTLEGDDIPLRPATPEGAVS